ncbi:MAG TPA: histidinol dehydrogenase [Desulfonatronum sp.]|nr:histidinol dehydrogenase [Desulfonatronum sp.]
MPCRELTYSSPADWQSIRQWLDKRRKPDFSVEKGVREILNQVYQHGDDALVDYSRQFDCPDFTAHDICVPKSEIQHRTAEIPAKDKAILEQAVGNVRKFHEQQVQRSWWQSGSDCAILGQMIRPVERVGLYVPGGQSGTTPLISSMIMNAVPAQVAGVDAVAVVTPPRRDGSLDPYLLAMAELLEVDELYRLGSAWAIAALALGTQTVPAVDVIAGPGNIHVTTAKRLLVGQVGIDMIAGPSEIVILADHTANAEWVAADMLSQAEHDPLAASILISTDADLIPQIKSALTRQLTELPRVDTARKSLADWGALVYTPSLRAGATLINRLAPEHLELCVNDPWNTLGMIRNAGAVFLGHHCPEPVGDYFAGPNHVLPTMGTARFASGLSVDNFMKKTNIISTNCEYLRAHGPAIARLASLEGLEAHARSVLQRTTEGT